MAAEDRRLAMEEQDRVSWKSAVVAILVVFNKSDFSASFVSATNMAAAMILSFDSRGNNCKPLITYFSFCRSLPDIFNVKNISDLREIKKRDKCNGQIVCHLTDILCPLRYVSALQVRE